MSSRRITKLNVHIANCQTHITYANDATRLLTNNPSGFAFRSTMDTSSGHCCGDSSSQTGSFFQRHFGKQGSIERTSFLDNFLLELGVSCSIDNEAETQRDQREDVPAKSLEEALEEPQAADLEEANKEVLKKEQLEQELHTCQLEQLPKEELSEEEDAVDQQQNQVKLD